MAASKTVGNALSAAFDAVREHLLPESKNLAISWHSSIPGLYESSTRAAGGVPDTETVEHLMDIADSYMDALEAKIKAELQHVVHTAAQASDAGVEAAGTDRIDEVLDRAGSELQRIVDTEAQRARSAGSLEGISQVAGNLGDYEPTCFFVVVRDDKLCDDCRRLHLLPDNKTPRVWRVAELSADYFNRKTNDTACVQGLHPHCRCSLTYLAKGFGFNDQGYVTFIAQNHDEWKTQRGA